MAMRKSRVRAFRTEKTFNVLRAWSVQEQTEQWYVLMRQWRRQKGMRLEYRRTTGVVNWIKKSKLEQQMTTGFGNFDKNSLLRTVSVKE